MKRNTWNYSENNERVKGENYGLIEMEEEETEEEMKSLDPKCNYNNTINFNPQNTF